MRAIILPEQNYHILLAIVDAYCRAGIDPEHLRAVSDTYDDICKAAVLPVPVPDTPGLGSAVLTSLSPNGVSLEVPLIQEAARDDARS